MVVHDLCLSIYQKYQDRLTLKVEVVNTGRWRLALIAETEGRYSQAGISLEVWCDRQHLLDIGFYELVAQQCLNPDDAERPCEVRSLHLP